ncbi:hypothetical protein GGF32_000360 [Allomyces javanicus]|nr:hypothetical protein GGF32_000360 [Allomyces javanicus]
MTKDHFQQYAPCTLEQLPEDVLYRIAQTVLFDSIANIEGIRTIKDLIYKHRCGLLHLALAAPTRLAPASTASLTAFSFERPDEIKGLDIVFQALSRTGHDALSLDLSQAIGHSASDYMNFLASLPEWVRTLKLRLKTKNREMPVIQPSAAKDDLIGSVEEDQGHGEGEDVHAPLETDDMTNSRDGAKLGAPGGKTIPTALEHALAGNRPKPKSTIMDLKIDLDDNFNVLVKTKVLEAFGIERYKQGVSLLLCWMVLLMGFHPDAETQRSWYDALKLAIEAHIVL